jgi:hypothetical protein
MASRRFLVAVSRASIHVTANPLRSDGHNRTKDSIATVRHLYLDFDIDGDARLTSLRTSDTVPTPTAVLSTSLGKHQILRSIDSFTFEQQESILKLPAIPFGGDPACMDCNRVLRLPRFRNCENDPSYPITVKYPCDSTSNPGDFRLDIPAANALPLPHAIPSRKHSGKHTNSEHDWAWILHKLAHGKDAAKLTRTIASCRSDNPRPLYLHPADGQCRISQTLPHRRRSDGGRLSGCWCSAAAPRLPLRGVSEKVQARMRWGACEEAYSWGRVRGFGAGVEGMILHSILWQCRNGASHRENFDTPPLRGCCKALRGAPERPVQNE